MRRMWRTMVWTAGVVVMPPSMASAVVVPPPTAAVSAVVRNRWLVGCRCGRPFHIRNLCNADHKLKLLSLKLKLYFSPRSAGGPIFYFIFLSHFVIFINYLDMSPVIRGFEME